MARKSKLLDLLDPRVRDVAPPGATADLLLRLQTAFQRGLEVGKEAGLEEAGRRAVGQMGAAYAEMVAKGAGQLLPPPPDPQAAKAAEEEVEARNLLFDLYLEDARAMSPEASKEQLTDALESYEPLRRLFADAGKNPGYAPPEGARVGQLKRALMSKGLWRPAPDDVEGQLAQMDLKGGEK